MRSELNQIVALVIGLVIFVIGSTAIIALAQEPSNLPEENNDAITVNVDPTVFESQYYAENPELMAAHRVEVGSSVDNALDQNLLTQDALDYPAQNQLGTQGLITKPHHPRLRGMLVY